MVRSDARGGDFAVKRENLRIANGSSFLEPKLAGVIGFIDIIRVLTRLDCERCADKNRNKQGRKAQPMRYHRCCTDGKRRKETSTGRMSANCCGLPSHIADRHTFLCSPSRRGDGTCVLTWVLGCKTAEMTAGSKDSLRRGSNTLASRAFWLTRAMDLASIPPGPGLLPCSTLPS